MSGPWCERCREWLTMGEHVCPPRWMVWREEDDEDDGREFYARRPERAVEMWAEEDDRSSADYLIVGGSEARVMVREIGTGKPLLRYVVMGETVPEYHAKLLKEPASPAHPRPAPRER